MLTENRAKPFCIFRSYPRGEIGHEGVCDVEALVPSACFSYAFKDGDDRRKNQMI
jgi:hypothetical protein